MKVKKRETFDAEQWFPGKEVKGVTGDKPNKWCGCAFTGGPANIPHIHQSMTECLLLKPGDWIVIDTKGGKCLVKPDIFDMIYEKA